MDVQVDQPAPEVAAAPQHVSAMFGGLAAGDGSADGAAAADGGTVPEEEHDHDQPRVEVAGVGIERPRQPAQLHYTAPSETGEVVERDVLAAGDGSGVDGLSAEQLARTPKNAACPCGSGKKFKMCHGKG